MGHVLQLRWIRELKRISWEMSFFFRFVKEIEVFFVGN